MSARLRRERATRASAVIGALCELWPRTFEVEGRNRRPLSIGIHTALLGAVAPAMGAGDVTVKDIKRALARYTSADGYLRNMRTGTGRLDLDGKIVGAVTPAEAKHARQILGERHRKKLAAHATTTCRRSDAGDSAIRTKTKGYGVPPCASVAEGVVLRHEKYPTP